MTLAAKYSPQASQPELLTVGSEVLLICEHGCVYKSGGTRGILSGYRNIWCYKAQRASTSPKGEQYKKACCPQTLVNQAAQLKGIKCKVWSCECLYAANDVEANKGSGSMSVKAWPCKFTLCAARLVPIREQILLRLGLVYHLWKHNILLLGSHGSQEDLWLYLVRRKQLSLVGFS